MINGAVNHRREAVVRLRLRGTNNSEAEIDAIVDTGFSESLTLPSVVMNALAYVRSADGSARLADGSTSSFDVCMGEVEWRGTHKKVIIYVVGDEPLVGMRLLAGHQLRVDVMAGGAVEIIPLS